jgi:ribose transport system ATP-binding protein
MELAGLCDRVLIFSRGRVIRELKGDDLTEEGIVSSFLRSREVASNEANASGQASERPLLGGLGRLVSRPLNQRWAPLVFLILLVLCVGSYATAKTDVFLTGLNLRHILYATAPLALVTMAQFTVLMVRGFDISVGSLMSLTVVIASFVIAGEIGTAAILAGAAVCPRRRVRGRDRQRRPRQICRHQFGDRDNRDLEHRSGNSALPSPFAARHDQR